MDTGRYRELSSWRRDFKKEWRALEKRQITLPINDAYRPNTEKWTCTCPAFVVSRFLICKHLIQNVQRVPPIFFLEAKRARSVPFWKHKTLRPMSSVDQVEASNNEGDGSDDDDIAGMDDDDDEGNFVETNECDGLTFEEAMEGEIKMITEFAKGLQYQVQFRDRRMLDLLQREGASFLRLARACLHKEKRMRRGGATPSTWEKSTINTMFYRARPAMVDQNT